MMGNGPIPLGFALGAATRKLAKFYARALADGPVTPSQLALLRQLWAEDGQQLRLLGQRAQLDATSATWLVDQLEAGGFLERRRTDADRRVVRVWLTDAGQRLREALEPEIARWEEAIAETLAAHHSAGEITTFRAVLATIIAIFPEGDDLWAARSALWDARLDALKTFVEADEALVKGTTDGDDAGVNR
ncbi:MAG: MarR family winged helix-turn-helix transcriptional regulator [Thermomicrobiales bacterium]